MAGKGQPHHGGAWKVAYADFVTTMMALFMVLWISVQDKEILIATSRYFQDPFKKSPMDDHSGIMPFNKMANDSKSSSSEQAPPSSAQSISQNKSGGQIAYLNAVALEIFRLLNVQSARNQRPIDVEVSTDGLRITIFDRGNRPLFKENTAEFTEWGRFIMQNLAWLIDRNKFRVMIDGHTRAHLALPQPQYTAWELSADRANAARRSLIYYAVDPGMIERVSGYADTHPLPGESPDSESNQRITLSLALSARPRPTPDPESRTAPGQRPPLALFPLNPSSSSTP